MVSFGYASDGTRTSKTANGVTTTYYYVGGRLYGETTGSNKLVYLYDDTGSPYGYVYNNATYYYERNAQGDVVSLFNANGVRIANYTYDAWGNVLTITDQNGNDVSNNATHQGNLNPIRYRGYYYDAELNMYWLTTRFYDPAIGRFINADTQLNEGLLGNNLYAYCENDPVNLYDKWGTEGCGCIAAFPEMVCSACQNAGFGEFLDTLAQRESSGRYDIRNGQYLGRYQLGTSVLVEIGWKDRDTKKWTEKAHLLGVYSDDDFLNSPWAQEVAVRIYFERLRRYYKTYKWDSYIGSEFCGVKVTHSGLLAAAHLVGVVGMKKALKNGQDIKDGNGVLASTYMREMGGYNVSLIMGW